MRRWSLWLAGCWLTLAPALSGQPVRLSGSFQASRTMPGAWDTRAAGVQGKGELRLGPFVLGRDFALYLAGQPGRPDISLLWVDAHGGAQRALGVGALPGDHWVFFRWRTPKAWIGRSVCLVAIDDSNSGWLGVGRPTSAATPWTPLLTLAGVQIACFILLLLPGAAWVLWKGGGIADALVASGLGAYAVFWCYFLAAGWGKAAAIVLLAGSAVASLLAWRSPQRRSRFQALAPMLAFTLFIGLAYLCILVLYGGAEASLTLPQDRFLAGMPPDTQIPFLLSDVWYRHLPVRPFLGDWLTSDRPPLQAALHLLVSPLLPRELSAEPVGIVAQSWIFLAFWSVLDAMGVRLRERVLVLVFTALSGFILFNTVFVWPKLLPAALLFLAFAQMQFAPGRSPIRLGLLAGLAMLSHGGSAFALLALAAVWLWRRLPGGWQYAWRAAAALLVCLVPWMLYQRCFDPPGDRLLKWHLAGVLGPDSAGFGAVLLRSYRALTWKVWLAGRWANVRHLFFVPGWDSTRKLASGAWAALSGQHADGWMNAGFQLRVVQMFLFFPALGILLLGLPPLFFRRLASDSSRTARSFLAVGTLVLIIWCLLMFEPGATVNHQGSYFANACWFFALGIGLARYPQPVIWLAVVIQSLLFFGGWVLQSPHSIQAAGLMPAAQAPAAICALAAGAAALAVLLSRPDPSELQPPGRVERRVPGR